MSTEIKVTYDQPVVRQFYKQAIVRTQFAALHCWTNAPAEVKFLQCPHRHIFHVEVAVVVDHGDRAVEFFILREQVNTVIRQKLLANTSPYLFDAPEVIVNLGLPTMSGSCEDMAQFIAEHLTLMYNHQVSYVSIFEDNENGGRIVYQ